MYYSISDCHLITHVKLAYSLHPNCKLILQRATANDWLLKSFFLIQESKLFDGTDLFQKLYLYLAKPIKKQSRRNCWLLLQYCAQKCACINLKDEFVLASPLSLWMSVNARYSLNLHNCSWKRNVNLKYLGRIYYTWACTCFWLKLLSRTHNSLLFVSAKHSAVPY